MKKVTLKKTPCVCEFVYEFERSVKVRRAKQISSQEKTTVWFSNCDIFICENWRRKIEKNGKEKIFRVPWHSGHEFLGNWGWNSMLWKEYWKYYCDEYFCGSRKCLTTCWAWLLLLKSRYLDFRICKIVKFNMFTFK